MNTSKHPRVNPFGSAAVTARSGDQKEVPEGTERVKYRVCRSWWYDFVKALAPRILLGLIIPHLTEPLQC